MSIQVQGNAGTVVEVETNSRAMRSTVRPVDPTSYGSYRGSATSGTMAAGLAGNANIFSFRWGVAAPVCIIREIQVQAFCNTTGFTAGVGSIQGFIARNFSASDTAGTAWTLTTNNMKLKTAFATTSVTDIRMSATAALSAGTRTLDAQPFASVGLTVPVTTVNYVILPWQWLLNPGANQWPIELAQNEGFVLQATVPATGTWGFSVNVQWDEVAAF